MYFAHYNQDKPNPKVSFILCDWSVRQSAHFLDYLETQTIDRADYEVIWIEYYQRKWEELTGRLAKAKEQGQPAPIDQWIILDISQEYCWHKHLMYNVATAFARGKIIVICDSDALVRPGFVASIIQAFEQDPNLVLHIDQLRLVDKRLYPFTYRPIKEVENATCLNAHDGKPEGLFTDRDLIHVLNYGACLCCLRKDVIDIGGFDQHQEYLGYICGPYDVTFRLLNAGKKELWSDKEWMYHPWHPGAGGIDNYCGPHDSCNVSVLALDTISNSRVMPLLENEFISQLRQNPEKVFKDPVTLNLPDTWKKSYALTTPFVEEPVVMPGLLKFNCFCAKLWHCIQHFFQKSKEKVQRKDYYKYYILEKPQSKFQEIKKVFLNRWQYSRYLTQRLFLQAKKSLSYNRDVAIIGDGVFVWFLAKAVRALKGKAYVFPRVDDLFKKYPQFPGSVMLVRQRMKSLNEVYQDKQKLFSAGKTPEQVGVIII